MHLVTRTNVLILLCLIPSLAWISQLLRFLYYCRGRLVYLKDLPPTPPPKGWPPLAILFAARNEAPHVGQAASSMLTQDYPDLQVIAIDDRSTDDTGAILDRIAATNAHFRVEHIKQLPDGWLGKNHALHVGAGHSTAEWLLFTDADVIHAPDSLRKAIAAAQQNGADHVTVTPDIVTETVGERIFVCMFIGMFSFYAPQWKVEDPRSQAHLGIGAFNLVRGRAFAAIGGFTHLALSVDDDMRLAHALKASGFRTLILAGQGSARVRWQVGLGGMIRGLEKNAFAGCDFQLPLTLLGVLGGILLGAGPLIGLFFGAWWTRLICAAGFASTALLIHLAGDQRRIPWYYAFLMPVGGLVFAFAVLRSTVLTIARGGIRWRDHHYPLDQLRAHVRQRNLWLKQLWASSRNKRVTPSPQTEVVPPEP